MTELTSEQGGIREAEVLTLLNNRLLEHLAERSASKKILVYRTTISSPPPALATPAAQPGMLATGATHGSWFLGRARLAFQANRQYCAQGILKQEAAPAAVATLTNTNLLINITGWARTRIVDLRADDAECKVNAPNKGTPRVTRSVQEDAFGRFEEKFTQMAALANGWDSYRAPAPLGSSLSAAKSFIQVMRELNYPPTRLEPSVVGGVGITQRRGNLKVYVEFHNKGTAFALYSDGKTKPNVEPVQQDDDGFRDLIRKMKEYFHVRASARDAAQP
jgi:hypothetical protein